jgi:hypothetical protein
LYSQLGYSQFCIISLAIASFVVSLVIARSQADYLKLAIAMLTAKLVKTKLTIQNWL